MAKLCILVGEDHTRHPIVRRQVETVGRAGHKLTILDQSDDTAGSATATYRWLRVHPIQPRLLARAGWVFLRYLRSDVVGEAWWTFVHFVGLVMTAAHYARLAFRENADYYHAHDLGTLLPAVVVGKLRGRTVVYDAHEMTSEQGDRRRLRNRVESLLERWLIPAADYLVVPSQARAGVYAARHRLKREPVVVLNCPPSMTVTRSKRLHERLCLPASTRIVLYHGTLMDGRALEELVRSARRFDQGVVLVLIGEQNAYYEAVLRPLWESEGLSDRVHFLPYIPPEQIMEYVASADLGVVIYKNISLNNYLCAPTKLYEYLMAGVAVIVSGFPEMLDLLQHYPVGRAFDPDSPSSIANAVNRFFLDEAGARQEIDRALSAARGQFTWELESIKLLALFSQRPSPA